MPRPRKPAGPFHYFNSSLEINGETHHLWRPVDQEGEILDSFVTKRLL